MHYNYKQRVQPHTHAVAARTPANNIRTNDDDDDCNLQQCIGSTNIASVSVSPAPNLRGCGLRSSIMFRVAQRLSNVRAARPKSCICADADTK